MTVSNSKVSIIMYHYVRNLKHSKYPRIKGLDINLFKEQIRYLKKHYHFITMEMLINSIENKLSLPEKSVLLTFDDAYSDHFEHVFPFLNKLKIQGSFYPPAKTVTEHTVLDVNKIHFILATEKNKPKIIKEIKIELDKYRNAYNLNSYSFYFEKLAHKSRYDTADVIFIKRLLQVELPENIRKIITNNLFEKIVGIPEDSFSKELYMNIEQLESMNRNNMHIGSHGYDHYWLGSLPKEKQKIEIEKSLTFLNKIGCDISQWTICYPYGNYNDSTLELLDELKCKLALTTKVDIANIQKNHRFALPRLDTNDIPKKELESPNEWYAKG